MGLIDLIKQINHMFPSPPVHTRHEEREQIKKIVLKYATGNTSLQFGRYITEDEISQRKLKLASYNFLSEDYS